MTSHISANIAASSIIGSGGGGYGYYCSVSPVTFLLMMTFFFIIQFALVNEYGYSDNKFVYFAVWVVPMFVFMWLFTFLCFI